MAFGKSGSSVDSTADSDQAFAEVFAAEESDEGRWRVFKAVDDVLPVLQATVFDPPGESGTPNLVPSLELEDQKTLGLRLCP